MDFYKKVDFEVGGPGSHPKPLSILIKSNLVCVLLYGRAALLS